MIGIASLLIAETFGPASLEWKQFRHDYKRTGRSALRGNCSSLSELYDRVHGGLDLSVIAVNVNSDGDHDIISAEYNNDGVAAKDGSSGSSIWNRYMSGEYFGRPMASVAASTSAGRVYAHGRSRFWVLSLSSGSVIYSWSKSSTRGESPLIADADSDGCPEIYITPTNRAYSVDGCASSFSYHWSVSLPADAHAAAMGDVDGDGDMEVLFPMTNGSIYVVDALTGTYHSSFSAGVPSSPTSPDYTVALGDLDGDGRDEVVVPRSSSIAVYDYTTSWSLRWSVSVSSPVAVALGDKDGDGLEDVWTKNGSNLSVYRGTDGAHLGSTSGLGMASKPPALLHLNLDGVIDAVVIRGYTIALVNGATMSVMGTYGTTPYSITSEVVPLKLSPTSIGFTVGDYSCHITTWGSCPLGSPDDELAVSEKGSVGERITVASGRVEVEVAEGTPVSLYTSSGRVVFEGTSKGKVVIGGLKKGVYLLKVGDRFNRIIVR